MANRKYQKIKFFGLFEQRIALQATYPEAKSTISHKTLNWTGKIRPTPLSKEYTVYLKYELRKAPRVWVVGDELQNLDAIDFPHHFEVKAEKKMVRICLYRYQEFSETKLLAKTIIPWTVEWLYFYEIWLATGEWLGGGEHPVLGKEKRI